MILRIKTKKRDYKPGVQEVSIIYQDERSISELNKYNRQKGTYGNGDGKDPSHKGW